jgi:hypothetical protein
MRSRSVPAVLAAALFLGGAAVGCAKAQARTQPDRVALEVPEAPPRLIEPLPSEPILDEADAVAAMPPVSPPAAPAPPRPPREPAPRPEPEPPPAVRTEAAPARPAPRLRTADSASDVEAERKLRDALTRASRDLDNVNPAALNADARAQYETAQRFIAQANEGLSARNYVFAGYLVDKAQTIATALLGR